MFSSTCYASDYSSCWDYVGLTVHYFVFYLTCAAELFPISLCDNGDSVVLVVGMVVVIQLYQLDKRDARTI